MKGKQLSFEQKDTDWELQAKEVPEEDIREVASIALDQDWTPPSSFQSTTETQMSYQLTLKPVILTL